MRALYPVCQIAELAASWRDTTPPGSVGTRGAGRRRGSSSVLQSLQVQLTDPPAQPPGLPAPSLPPPQSVCHDRRQDFALRPPPLANAVALVWVLRPAHRLAYAETEHIGVLIAFHRSS